VTHILGRAVYSGGRGAGDHCASL